MKTVTVDAYQRVRLPGAKKGAKFALEDRSNGYLLTEVKAESQEKFPRGSLLKYFTAERNREELQILKGCVQSPP